MKTAKKRLARCVNDASEKPTVWDLRAIQSPAGLRIPVFKQEISEYRENFNVRFWKFLIKKIILYFKIMWKAI